MSRESAQAIAAYTDLGAKLGLPFYLGLLAALENERQSARGALPGSNRPPRSANKLEHIGSMPSFTASAGGILLKCDPTETEPAEQALPPPFP